jgi:hypothetical protein
MKIIPELKLTGNEMRFLTQYEQSQFDSAFTCIMRLSIVYDSKRDIDMFAITTGGEALPSIYKRLIGTLGGLDKVVYLFCPLYRDRAIKWLIEWCFDNKIQPSAFALAGVLGIGPKRSYTVEYEFKSKDAE